MKDVPFDADTPFDEILVFLEAYADQCGIQVLSVEDIEEVDLEVSPYAGNIVVQDDGLVVCLPHEEDDVGEMKPYT